MASVTVLTGRFEFRLFTGNLKPADIRLTILEKGSSHRLLLTVKLKRESAKSKIWLGEVDGEHDWKHKELIYKYTVWFDEIKSFETQLKTLKQTVKTHRDVFRTFDSEEEFSSPEEIIDAHKHFLKEILEDVSERNIEGVLAELTQSTIFNRDSINPGKSHDIENFMTDMFHSYNDAHVLLVLGIIWSDLEDIISIEKPIAVPESFIEPLRELTVKYCNSNTFPRAFKKSILGLEKSISHSLENIRAFTEVIPERQATRGTEGLNRPTTGRTMDITFNTVIRCHEDIKQVRLKTFLKNADSKPKSSMRDAETVVTHFQEYTDLQFSHAKWMFSTAKVTLIRSKDYYVRWEVEEKNGKKRQIPMASVYVKNLPSILSSCIRNVQGDDGALQSIQGSLILLDVHQQNDTDIGDDDVVKRLEDIKKYCHMNTSSFVTLGDCVKTWLDCRLKKSSHKQRLFILYVLKKLKILSLRKHASNPLSRHKSLIFLEVLRCQKTLPKGLHVSWDFLYGLLKCADIRSRLDIFYYLSQHLSPKELMTSKPKWGIDINKHNWNDVEKKITQILGQLSSKDNRDDEEKLDGILQCIISRISTVDVMLNCIGWFQQNHIQTQVIKKNDIWKCLSRDAFELLMKSSRSDWVSLPSLVDSYLQAIYPYLDRHANIKIFEKLCKLVVNDSYRELLHIVDFLYSGWLIWILPKLEKNQQHDLLSKLTSFIKQYGSNKINEEVFCYHYRVAISPSLLDVQARSKCDWDVIKEYENELFNCEYPIEYFKMCFYREHLAFNSNELIYVTRHIMRLTLSDKDKILCLTELFLQVSKYTSNEKGQNIDTMIEAKQMVARSLLNEMEVAYDTEQLNLFSNAERYLKRMLTIQSEWQLISTDPMLKNTRNKMLNILRNIYQKQKEKHCSFAHADFLKKYRDNFTRFVGMFEGLGSIKIVWLEVIDNIINDVDDYRRNVTHLRRLMELLVKLNNRTVVGIETAQLQGEIQNLETMTAIGSDEPIFNADKGEFWGSFQSILKYPSFLYVSNSVVFFNICLNHFESSNSVTRLEDLFQELRGVCIPRYEKIWQNIGQNALQMKVSHVANDLQVITDTKELRRELHAVQQANVQTITEEMKAALSSFVRRKKCQELLDVFKIFKIQHSDGVPEVLQSSDMNNICLLELHETMTWIDGKFYEETDWPILSELSKCGDLVEFLALIIKNEEDLRYLGDIMEENDRGSIHIGLVADIIDVKRFIQPLLQVKRSDMIGQVIECITEVGKGPLKSTLSMKIKSCRSNIFVIKEMYNKLADRRETTRVIIKNSIDNGTFYFSLKGCDSSYVTEMCYETSTGIKGNLPQEDLQDLKNRALLAVNSGINEVVSSGDVACYKDFVRLITDAADITDLLNDLYNSGHFQYVYCLCKSGCPGARRIVSYKSQDLARVKPILQQKYKIWIEVLREVRLKFYHLTLFDSNKLWMLEQLLSQFSRLKRVTFEVILKQLGMNYTRQTTRDMIYAEPEDILKGDEKMDWTKESNKLRYETAIRKRLMNLGQSLETSFVSHPGEAFTMITERAQSTIDFSNTLFKDIVEHRVQSGTVSLVIFEEGKSHPILILLQLYRDTTGKFPKLWHVLFCKQDTLMEEVELFLQRCRGASKSQPGVLFTIVNAELVSRDIRFYILNEIRAIYKKGERFMLAIIISDRSENKSEHFVDRFRSLHITHYVAKLSGDKMAYYLRQKWGNFEIVTSETPGLGKTEYVKSQALKNNLEVVNISFHGSIDRDNVIKQLSQLTITKNTMLHIDVGVVSNLQIFDILLLEVMVFGIVQSNQHVFSLDTDHICVELANQTTRHAEVFPGSVQLQGDHVTLPLKPRLKDPIGNDICFSSIFPIKHLQWRNFHDYIVSREINSSVQVVCHYLQAATQNKIDSEDIKFVGEDCKPALKNSVCKKLLKEKFKDVPNHLMSFSVLEMYLNVFAGELRRLSASEFFSTAALDKTVEVHDVKSQFVHALDNMAMSFTPFETCCHSEQEVETEITSMKWEASNHTLLVFNSQDIETVTPFYRSVKNVEPSIKKLFESQLNRELPDYKDTDKLKDILEKVCRTSRNRLDEPKFDYALTTDNLLKMILIFKRVMAGIPVIIMGETGCGKTLLLTYLAYICEVPFYTMNIHAGTERNDIQDFIQKPIEEAKKTEQEAGSSMVWVFFDEINTCDHLSLLCEIMLRNSCDGCKLPTNLVFLAACNPYNKRKEGTFQTDGGLPGTCNRDGKSSLVYRVEPLPKQMLPYVWDFGTLQEKDESRYIDEMTKKLNAEIKDKELLKVFSNTVSKLQTFTKTVERTQYCVSLRDVRRCIDLALFFVSQWLDVKDLAEITEYLPSDERRRFTGGPGDEEPGCECKLRSVILALAHCYHCRIVDDNIGNKTENNEDKNENARTEFLNIVSKCFIEKYPHVTSNYVNAVIIGEQMGLLDKMDIPKGIAKNSALRENVFVILICILAHIPVFVVGNPGSSKSLSMQLIKSNLRGLDSKTEFFKKLPVIYVLSYQGSDSSTSQGIIEVFHKAQQSLTSASEDETQSSRVLPVVMLDEVGLAENSPRNPLKVLHSLLEPKLDPKHEIAKVSVVGISNWALDPAKMNRAVYLSRVEPSARDLYETAKTIRDVVNKGCDHIISDGLLTKVADAYVSYTTYSKHEHFHGLRDYYALIKYISAAVSDDNTNSTAILENAIRRNFGGFPCALLDPSMASSCAELKLIEKDQRNVSGVFDMITENINDKTARHLMIITDISNEDLLRSLMEQQLKGREHKIMFGSNFKNDFSEDYFYRIMSSIILYMEKGVTVVFKNLTSIYGSLYDMLNQNYTTFGGKNSCRIALGPIRSPLCEVHKDFRCIVLIDEHKVDYTDPPFLNRFEKQFLTVSDVLSPQQNESVKQLQSWTKSFRITGDNEPNPDFNETDVFIGFHNNLIASVVYNMPSKELTCDEVTKQCKNKLLSLMCPEGLVRASRSEFMVQDPEEFRNIENKYLQLPHHNGLVHFFKTSYIHSTEQSMTIIYTHTSIHSNIEDMVKAEISARVERLSHFSSEQEFTEMICKFWSEEKGKRTDTLLILQCSPQVDGPRMSSVRYLIHDYKRDAMNTSETRTMAKHVCIIVHVDRRENECSDSWQYSSIQGWDQVTIDSLFPPSYCFKTIVGKTVLQLIAEDVVDFEKIGNEELTWALSCIRYIHGQTMKNVSDVKRSIAETDFLTLIRTNLIKNMKDNRCSGLEKPQERYGWLSMVAFDKKILSIHGTFDAAVIEAVRLKIQRILTKCLFFMSKNSAWLDFNSDPDTFALWKVCIQSNDILDICDSSIPEPNGPLSCIICTKPFKFRFPFFMVFHEKIENQIKQNEEHIRSLVLKHGTNAAITDEDQDTVFAISESRIKTVLPILEDAVEQAVNEVEFHNYLDSHVDIYEEDLFTVFLNNLHDYLPEESLQLLNTFLKNAFKPMLDSLEKAISKVAILYFQMWMAKDHLLAILQLISTYIEFSNSSEIPRHWQKETKDRIVEKVCELTLPTSGLLKSVGGAQAWQKKATSVILCAGRVAEDTSCVFHFLRLCRNFCALVLHLEENDFNLADLADLGRNLQETIATPEILNNINDKINDFRRNKRNSDNVSSVQMIEDFAGTFFMTAFDANPDDCFLTTALEKMYDKKDGNLAAFASPLLFHTIQRDIEESDDSLFEIGCWIMESTDCIYKDKFPNIFLLDKFLRQQYEIDNPIAVLCCDLIQKIVFGQLDIEKQVVLDVARTSISVIANSHRCTMQLMFSIAFISALFKGLANIPKEDLLIKCGYIFNTSFEEELQRKRLIAMEIYLLKHRRQMCSMHDAMDLCGQLKIHQSSSQISLKRINYSPMSYVEYYKEARQKFQKYEDNPEHPNESDLGDILSRANNQIKMALALSAVVIERFVIGRSIDHSASTERQLIATTLRKIRANLSQKRLFSQLLEHLLNGSMFTEFAEKLGNDSFKVTQQISVIAHIVSIILMDNYKGSFYQCLYPNSSMTLPASGTPVPKLTAANIDITGSWMVVCPSCSVQVVGSQRRISRDMKHTEDQQKCPACQASWKQVTAQCENSKRSILDSMTTGYYRRSKEELMRPDLSIRNLHPIAYRVLSIITHSIFLVGHFNNPEDNEDKIKLFDLEVEESAQSDASSMIKIFLFDQIDQDWNVLQTLLQRNTENTAIFIHSVIKESSDFLKDTQSFKNPFETQFSEIIMVIYRSEYLQNFKRQSYKCIGINDTDIEFEIEELCKESSLEFPRLLRHKQSQTFIHFKMDVLKNLHFSTDLREKHMFLCLVMSMKDQLECLCHIKPIIEWYRIVFNKLSHRLERQDARKRIKEFIDSGVLGYASHEQFANFKDSWNAVEQIWKNLTGEEPTFGQMSDERELAVCLDQSEDQPCTLKTIINVLVEIQNQFLLKAHCIATSGRCLALKLQINDDRIAALETIPIPESRKEIIVFKWDDRYFINSYVDTENGANIKYNYALIERQLYAELVLNKKLLTTKHTFYRFVYHDDLFAEISMLLQEINLVIPQEKIDEQIQENISRRYQPGDENSKKVLEQIEIVLSFLQRSGGESTQLIHQYTSEIRFNSSTNDLSSETFKTLKLCHIVHLYELFEDIMATSSLLQLSIEVCEKLDMGASSKLGSALEKFDMEDISSLSSVVRIFMYRYLQSTVVYVDKIDSPLKDVVSKKITMTPELDELIREIPTEVQIRHARDALWIIERQIKKLRQPQKSDQVQQAPLTSGRKRRQHKRTYYS